MDLKEKILKELEKVKEPHEGLIDYSEGESKGLCKGFTRCADHMINFINNLKESNNKDKNETKS